MSIPVQGQLIEPQPWVDAAKDFLSWASDSTGISVLGLIAISIAVSLAWKRMGTRKARK